jgi:hypothetical protein
VRIRWGGARHKDRYRWATWTGRLAITRSGVESFKPWAAAHPEQLFNSRSHEITWHTATYGTDIGVVVSLADLASARLQIETTIAEDDLEAELSVTGAELLATGHRRIEVGGLNLALCVERIADPTLLPVTVTGNLSIDLPRADSAVYLRARQADGHQVWTSPLFIDRQRAGSC